MATIKYLTTTHFEHGAVAKLGAHAKRLGMARPLVVTDPGIVAAGLLDKALAGLGENAPHALYSDTPANPTERAAKAALEVYRAEGCDGVIGFGGGSAMDLAKTVSLLATHDLPLEALGAMSGGARKIGPIAPVIAVPTTAGTGSEVSVGAVVILENGKKDTFISDHLIPALALCDPDLTIGLPPSLTAATGMDAVTHCVEALFAPTVNPPAEAIALDGIERAVRLGALERAVADGADKDARWHMMMAALEGALSFVKGLGAVHALSHAAGRLEDKKLHHGTLNAVFLPHVLRAIEGAAPDKEDRLRRAMGLGEGADLADAVAALNARIGVPANLSAMGLAAEDGPGIVEYALKDAAHLTNARPFEQVDYEQVYAAALG